MSVKKNISEFSQEDKKKVDKELTIKLKSPIKNVPPKIIVTYNVDDLDNVILPFAYGISNFNLKKTRPKREFLPNIDVEFTGELRPEQLIVKNEIVRDLNKTGSGCISAYPGFGKTCMAINIACTIKLRTLIIVNKIILIKQWEESIKIFSPKATIQKVKPRAKLEDCDFYIINAQNVEKMGLEFFSNIGLCVVDEMHMIMAETLSRSLHYIFPRYLLGLSATPYRPDDLDILINYYFGNNKVIRELHREHHVYVVETGITYKVEKTIDGRLNWGNLLDQQSEHEERNQRIINIVRKFNTRNFLILVKRVKQGKMLENSLKELGEDVTSLLGNSQEFNKESRILIGTCQKVGVGFDHKKLDALLLATDIEEYFIQYLGRVFRTRNQIPIVFDLVDNQQTLKRHYNTRKEVYLKHGGIITSNPC